MSALGEFDAMCDRMGVPRDRRELVKRNLQLKGLLEGTLRVVHATYESMHVALEHVGEYSNCERAVCVGGRKRVDDVRKNMA